jgi:mannose-6-phosphate isomerase-like protein (cupin superfamily)
MTELSLERFPLHLGRGGSALPQPEMTGPEWYEAYGQRSQADGVDGRLVSMHSFSESWSSWEMHPAGDEVLLCVSGKIVLHQQQPDGTQSTRELGPGEYAINPPGVWHTADVEGPATALFITVGEGTAHKPR